MTNLRDRTNNHLEKLLELTRDALSQARVRQLDALTETMRARERVLAALWGLPDGQPLPPYTSELADSKRHLLGEFDRELADQVKVEEEELLRVLRHHLKTLQDERRQMNDGQRYMTGVRSLYETGEHSRYMDHRG